MGRRAEGGRLVYRGGKEGEGGKPEFGVYPWKNTFVCQKKITVKS